MTHIAVVGAVIAGLGAALTLQDAGLSCTIYEASHRIGGRMHSDAMTWADGMVSEWCEEFIDADHETMHQLINMRHRQPIPRRMTSHSSSNMPRTACSNWSMSSLASAPTIPARRR